MGILGLEWKSPKNWFEQGEKGSWTNLTGFIGDADRRISLLFILGSVVSLIFAYTNAVPLSVSLGVSAEQTRIFLNAYVIIFTMYLIFTGWEIVNKESLVAIIAINDIKEHWKLYLGLGITGGLAMLVFGNLILRIAAVGQLLPLKVGLSVILFIFIWFNVVSEESFFRGWLFPHISETYGVYIGMVVSAAIFMLFHWYLFGFNLKIQAFSFVFALLANGMTGMTQSTFPSIIMHLFVNIVGVMQGG